MISLIKKITFVYFICLLCGCKGFFNPTNDCFLDWNMNCIDREKHNLSKAGYIYTYPGDKENAKTIFNKCTLESKGNISSREQCLLSNGFKKN